MSDIPLLHKKGSGNNNNSNNSNNNDQQQDGSELSHSGGFYYDDNNNNEYQSYQIINNNSSNGAILNNNNNNNNGGGMQRSSSTSNLNSKINQRKGRLTAAGDLHDDNVIDIHNSNSNNQDNKQQQQQQHKHKPRFTAVPDQPMSLSEYGVTDEMSMLEAKRAIQNHMFGFRPFKSKITKKRAEDHSPETRLLYTDNPVVDKGVNSIGNYIYSIFFGSILFIIFCLLSLILSITYFGIPYARITWNMKWFVLFPFGKFFLISTKEYGGLINGANDERQPLRSRNYYPSPNAQYSKTSIMIGLVFWYLLAAPILVVFHGIILVFTWLIVVMIPTSKMHTKILFNLLKNPLQVCIEINDPSRPDCQLIHYPVEAFNFFYYKYTINGMNVCLVNLLPFVILSLVFGYFFEHVVHPVVIFLCCILSTIPLSYYNGMAIASLSAQTSFAIGALINASFGSIIELILYIVTINGQQEEVARSALTGALLGAMLLIPGLSMVIGGIKHKEQKFNPTVMGVSTALLTVAVIGAFAPTIYYKIYGNYSLSCTGCVEAAGSVNCGNCAYVQKNLDDDPVYTNKARTLMYIISGTLPVAYLIGLLFTLKTHTHILHPIEKDKHTTNNNNNNNNNNNSSYSIISNPHHNSNNVGNSSDGMTPHQPPSSSSTPQQQQSNEGHGHKSEGSVETEWSKKQCIAVLCVCTTMFALVSEKLVESIDPVVSLLGLTHEFLGVTILGIIPSAAEYLNAIQFALNNNMPLALEIGASAAVQITLFQMPVLVFICAVINHLSSNGSFTLIFPLIDFFAVFFGVIVMNFVFNNGRTNYFIGSTLCMVYLIIVFAFFFTPDS